jgi:hypothetical protein
MENDPELLKDILEKDFKWAAVDLVDKQDEIKKWQETVELLSQQENLITCE